MGSIGLSKEVCETMNPNDGSPLATRKCLLSNESLNLTDPVLFNCSTSLQTVLADFTDTTIDTTAFQTVVLTSKPENLNVQEVNTTAVILHKIMQDPAQLNQEISRNTISTFCNILEVKQDIIEEVQAELSSLTEGLENMSRFVDLDQTCSQLAVKSSRANSSINADGLGIVSYQGPFAVSGNNKINLVHEENDINISSLEAYIFLLNKSFNPDTQFGFVLYKDASFFQTPKKKNSFVMKTQVISAVVNETINSFNKSVTIKLRKKDLNDGFYLQSYECVSWNYSVGRWSKDGCYLVDANDNATHFTCHCSHLTNFAILMTIKGKTLQYLDTISYIGCTLSIVGLLATVIVPIWMRDYRTSVNGKLQINLSVALLGVYITFLVGAINSDWANATPDQNNIAQSENPFCTASTWFLHFFLLSSFAWMCVQGIALYSSYNRLIQQMERSYFAAVSAGVAWGAPALIAIITISVTQPKSMYRQKNICWLAVPGESGFFSGSNVLLWAFFLPVSLVLLMNVMIFGLIMSKMVCNKKNLKAYKGDFKKTLQKHFAMVFANTVTLGMCWITGYLMLIEEAYSIFSTLFCILNSLQGVFIFLLCWMNVNEFKNRMKQPLQMFRKEKRTTIAMKHLIRKEN
ncbi:adhesion G-protein coupled receptor G7-like [Stegostoma tigrinum]|uniref:adhesion G-protein coupled receptor G7-like n=1 Tax=Stegostoma tigrinum TaxID=3053191 RepID=UPI00287081AB|nr:adhesion G-protein coupled receptor G7-like [Stegostoma tigrinum]